MHRLAMTHDRWQPPFEDDMGAGCTRSWHHLNGLRSEPWFAPDACGDPQRRLQLRRRWTELLADPHCGSQPPAMHHGRRWSTPAELDAARAVASAKNAAQRWRRFDHRVRASYYDPAVSASPGPVNFRAPAYATPPDPAP